MSIIYCEEKKSFIITTLNSMYAMEINSIGNVVHTYWGNKVKPEDLPVGEILRFYPHEEEEKKATYNQEYVGWGGYFYDEPDLKVEFSDHVRDLELKYFSHKIISDDNSETLIISLKDTVYPFWAHVQYKIYNGFDLIDRNCILENQGADSVKVESAQSATWYVPRGKKYRLSYLSGRWSGEYQMNQIPMTQGKHIWESRRGISGPDMMPWFALDKGTAEEEAGDVWYGILHWAGNWKICAELDRLEQVKVTGGMNDFDFLWTLKPGEKFETPVFTGGFTDIGFGKASRELHRYQRELLIPQSKAKNPRKIIYNSWEAVYFDISEQQQMKLAEKAAAVGAEVFVLDDGWMSTRDWCDSGLGDWWPSKKKFPNGLTPLIKCVNDLGMDFGIWVEPEMVNPDSDLFRAHPDWIIRFPTRKGTQMRNQFILNLARDEIKEFVYSVLADLVKNNNIKYIKWDMNRYFTEPGWPENTSEDQRSIWVKYVWNLYEICERMQKEFPDVMLETCCSGGGRVNLGLAKVSDMLSRSDNSDPLDSLKLHYGYSYAYLPKIAGASSVGVSPNGINQRISPLKYRMQVAMLTTPYINLNLLILSEEELAVVKEQVDLYKQIRPVVQEGEFYRIVSPYEYPLMACEYVSEDLSEAVLFVLGQSVQFMPPPERIRLKGLNPDYLYEIDGEQTMSGKGLMELGIEVLLVGDFDSRIIRIKKK